MTWYVTVARNDEKAKRNEKITQAAEEIVLYVTNTVSGLMMVPRKTIEYLFSSPPSAPPPPQETGMFVWFTAATRNDERPVRYVNTDNVFTWFATLTGNDEIARSNYEIMRHNQEIARRNEQIERRNEIVEFFSAIYFAYMFYKFIRFLLR